MKLKTSIFLVFVFCFFVKLSSQESFVSPDQRTSLKPWSVKGFDNNPSNFQFAIVTDRTGGHRAGIFGKAVEKLNLLRPEFVMSVGDLIEGYTEDVPEIEEQWAEFDSLLNPLDMRFFYVPGNHDISNGVMRKEWEERYGKAYYHFKYKDVLFLAFDSNEIEEGTGFSQGQIDYFKEVLKQHTDVRWTLIFMHHPIWVYRDLNGFDQIEEALKDRPYTVYAGHFHRYMHAMRQDRNYYILSTTGGGSRLLGPKFGQFDHVTWVTMTDDGPVMVNLKLDGMIKGDITNQETLELAQSLIQAARFETLVIKNADQSEGKLYINVSNTTSDSLILDARIYHHHHMNFDQSKLALRLGPNDSEQIVLPWVQSGDLAWERMDPVELDFTIGYPTDPLDHPFQLDGTFTVPKVIKENQIEFINVFAPDRKVMLASPISEMDIRYTLDGSEPTRQSPKYTEPFALTEAATLKVALFDPESGNGTTSIAREFKTPAPKMMDQMPTKEGLSYQYYEDNFVTLPDFEKIQPIRSGVATDLKVEDIAGEERVDHYAIAYEGYLEVPEDGLYTLYTYSDDGSKLYLHNELIVDNGGSHSARLRKGQVVLNKGKHPIRIEYFEDFAGQVLDLYWKKPDARERERISFKALSH